MELTKIRRTRSVQVQVGEETVRLDFAPRRWDAVFVQRHNEMLDAEDEGVEFPERGRERYIFTLSQVVTGWDVTVEGEGVEVSEELLRQVDDLILFAMYSAVRRDVEGQDEAKNC